MQATATKAALIERRRCRRTATRLLIILTVDVEGSALSGSANTLDFSAIGARIRTTLRLTPGQSVNVLVPDKKGDAVSGRVVWVGAPEGGRQAGVEFLSRFD
ncbi:MAG TPA: PilZ domain-containing protein [Terriglobia bacterium]